MTLSTLSRAPRLSDESKSVLAELLGGDVRVVLRGAQQAPLIALLKRELDLPISSRVTHTAEIRTALAGELCLLTVTATRDGRSDILDIRCYR